MDLADENTIFEIINPKPPRRPREPAAPQIRPASKTVFCHCGKCPRCLDNARWERIFREKFADEDYYSERPPLRGSSLSDVK
jgi:hypothetical protein